MSLLDGFSSRLGHHNPVFRFQVAGEKLAGGSFVIHNQNQRFFAAGTYRNRGLNRFCQLEQRFEAVLDPAGRVKVNRLPLPGSLSSEIAPPCCSTRRFVMASPNPVP